MRSNATDEKMKNFSTQQMKQIAEYPYTRNESNVTKKYTLNRSVWSFNFGTATVRTSKYPSTIPTPFRYHPNYQVTVPTPRKQIIKIVHEATIILEKELGRCNGSRLKYE